jgi:hypothetical protein
MKFSLYDASVIDLIKEERFEVTNLAERIASVSEVAREQILLMLAVSGNNKAREIIKQIQNEE